MSKLMEQIEKETSTQCYIKFNVNDDGKLDYDKNVWKVVEPKICAGWGQSHIFDIISKVYISEDGLISKFTIEVDKKKPSRHLPKKLEDVEISVSGECIIAEFGGVVNKNFNDVISDIRVGYLPRIMEVFEQLERTQLSIDVAFAQLKINKYRKRLQMVMEELKEAQQKLEKSTKV